jgi:hypothetical protein
MLMSSNDYQKLKSSTTRFQPRVLGQKKAFNKTSTLMLNQDLINVIPDVPKHNFMKTVTFGKSSSVSPSAAPRI